MWPFESGEARKAKQLVRLADQTISLMQSHLSQMARDVPDRGIVEAHLARRHEERDRYAKLARRKRRDRTGNADPQPVRRDEAQPENGNSIWLMPRQLRLLLADAVAAGGLTAHRSLTY